MKIIFHDILQDSDAPEQLVSPALADKYSLEEEVTIAFDEPVYMDCIAAADARSGGSPAAVTVTAEESVAEINGGNAGSGNYSGIINAGGAEYFYFTDIINGGGAAEILTQDFEFEAGAARRDVFHTFKPHKDRKYKSLRISAPAGSGTTIGRVAAGRAVNIPTAVKKEPGYASTAEPRKTLSGQVIPGAGGYSYRTLSLDSRYKLDRTAMKEIEAGYAAIGRGYPFFINLSDEEYKLGFDFLYATEKNQRQMSFEGGIRRFLYSRRWEFEEAF